MAQIPFVFWSKSKLDNENIYLLIKRKTNLTLL